MKRSGNSEKARFILLRANRENRYFRYLRTPKSFLRACLLAAVVASLAAPAFAMNEPLLVSTYPASSGTARHVDVVDVIARYDRDLDASYLRFELRDNANAAVAGVAHFVGPKSTTGGYRAAGFHPAGALSETASPYTATVKVRSSVATDVTTTVFHFSIDDTAPVAPVVTSPTNGGVDQSQPVVVRGTSEPGATVIIDEGTQQIAGDQVNQLGSFAITLPYPNEDGVTHEITAQAIDRAGNVGPATPTITFSHDSIRRVPVIIAPAEGSYYNTSTIEVSGEAKPNTSVTISESGAARATTTADANGAWSTPVAFAAGAHSISASSWDGVFDDGPSQARAFTIDLSAPAAPIITAPAPGASIGSRTVSFTGTAEPNATVRIREGVNLRGTAPVDGVGAWSIALPFSEGAHAVTAQAFDRANNPSATAALSFTVDTVAPTTPAISTPSQGAFVNTNPVTVSGSSEPGATIKLYEGTVLVGTATADAVGSWSVAVGFTQAAHSIRAGAFDAAQNQSPLTPWRAFTVDTVAPAAPVITSPTPGETVNSASVKIVGTGEPAATITIDEALSTIGTTSVSGSGDWWIFVTFSNGSHTITARAADPATNTSPSSAPVTFTVSAIGDVTPPPAPTITNPASGSIQPGFVIFEGIAEPLSTVHVYEGLIERANGSADGSGNWRLGANVTSGSHTVTANAVDPSGNVSPMSPARTFTVDAELPVVTFSTVQGSFFLSGAVEIEGTATDNLGVERIALEYRDLRNELVLTANADVCSGCPGGSVTWRAEPDLPIGVYTATAVAIDVAGNQSKPATLRFYVL